MRIFVFSDTHGRTEGCIRLLENMHGCVDAVLHAGDVSADIEALQAAFPDLPVYGVSGNNDFQKKFPLTQTLTFDGVTLILTHGHRFKVKYTYEDIADAAIEAKATLAVFGHTHQSCDRTENGIHLLNPGSAGGLWATYAVIEIESGQFKTDILSMR